MEDAGPHFVEIFHFAAGGKNSQVHGANEKIHTHTHTISNIHGEVFKAQLEIHYESYLG